MHHAAMVTPCWSCRLDYFFQVLSPGKFVNDIDDVFFQDRFGWRHCCAIFSALQSGQNLGRYKQSSWLWTRISKSEPLPTHLSRMQHKSSTHTFPLSSHCKVLSPSWGCGDWSQFDGYHKQHAILKCQAVWVRDEEALLLLPPIGLALSYVRSFPNTTT